MLLVQESHFKNHIIKETHLYERNGLEGSREKVKLQCGEFWSYNGPSEMFKLRQRAGPLLPPCWSASGCGLSLEGDMTLGSEVFFSIGIPIGGWQLRAFCWKHSQQVWGTESFFPEKGKWVYYSILQSPYMLFPSHLLSFFGYVSLCFLQNLGKFWPLSDIFLSHYLLQWYIIRPLDIVLWISEALFIILKIFFFLL